MRYEWHVDTDCLRASKFSVLKLIEIVILWVYYTIPFGFSLFRHFWLLTFQPFKLHCLAKDHWRGFSTRNAHMVHIVNWIQLKWCIHLSRSLFLHYSYIVKDSAKDVPGSLLQERNTPATSLPHAHVFRFLVLSSYLQQDVSWIHCDLGDNTVRKAILMSRSMPILRRP